MEISVIVIGDELLIGQVQDTNSGWIARQLAPLGWNVKSVRVVADNARDIENAINLSFDETDVILTTGGLGPTKDDITKSVLCNYFGGEMILDSATLENVKTVLEKRHLQMNELNEQQAVVPNSCRVIQNEVGTAPIMWFEKDGKVLVSMPGVPFEMETMMQRTIIKQLIDRFESQMTIEYRTFVVIDYPESVLAIKLDEFENNLPETIHLAYLPKSGIIRLRLSGKSDCSARLKAQMELASNQLTEILGKSIISYEDKPLSAILGDKLRSLNLTVATAESCTGGNIAHQITEIAGSSEYFVGTVVSYTNEVKNKLLNVSDEVLKEYGAVSKPTVEQMCIGVSELLGTDCALATSGIAGPGGAVPGKPVGTVWMAAKYKDKLVSQVKQLPGSRERVIDRATLEVQLMLLRLLNE